jgi:hypothetical protein
LFSGYGLQVMAFMAMVLMAPVFIGLLPGVCFFLKIARGAFICPSVQQVIAGKMHRRHKKSPLPSFLDGGLAYALPRIL